MRVLVAVLLAAAAATGRPPSRDIDPRLARVLTRDLRFSDADLAELQRGRIVKRTGDAPAPGEVAVAGAARVRASADSFLAQFRDIEQFKRGVDVLEIGRFSDAPVVGDLAGLTIGKDDIDLRNCRVGDCDIRLPADLIGRFQHEIDWRAPDADARAAVLFKRLLVNHVRAYLTGHPGRIAEYNDGRRPIRPGDEFAGVLQHTPAVDDLVPGLAAHLQSFPFTPLEGAEDFVYWSKEKFGLTPFITVTQVTIVRGAFGGYVITTKDVYSSRYIDASLGLAIASDATGNVPGFYLVYANRSRANGLKGAFSGLRRAIVERRSKGALEENLRLTRQRLEANH